MAAAVVGAATIVGVWWRRRQGRFAAVNANSEPHALLLFTTPTCTSCRQVRDLCAAENIPYEEVDASVDLDRARAFDVWRAPTLVVVDRDGEPVWRATGVPTKADLVAAVRP